MKRTNYSYLSRAISLAGDYRDRVNTAILTKDFPEIGRLIGEICDVIANLQNMASEVQSNHQKTHLDNYSTLYTSFLGHLNKAKTIHCT